MPPGRPRTREPRKPKEPAPVVPAALRPETLPDPVESSEPRGPGRPSNFVNIDMDLARRFAKAGLTDEQIAELLGISIRSYYEYKKDFPEFSQAIKEGAEDPKARVSRALYQRAVGYTHEEEKIFLHEGKPVRVITAKHYPPDPKCIEFYLINKVGDEYKNISHVQASGSVNHNHKGSISSALMEDLNKALLAMGEQPSAENAKRPVSAEPRREVRRPAAPPTPPIPKAPAPPEPEPEDAEPQDTDEIKFSPQDYEVNRPSMPLDTSDLESD